MAHLRRASSSTSLVLTAMPPQLDGTSEQRKAKKNKKAKQKKKAKNVAQAQNRNQTDDAKDAYPATDIPDNTNVSTSSDKAVAAPLIVHGESLRDRGCNGLTNGQQYLHGSIGDTGGKQDVSSETTTIRAMSIQGEGGGVEEEQPTIVDDEPRIPTAVPAPQDGHVVVCITWEIAEEIPNNPSDKPDIEDQSPDCDDEEVSNIEHKEVGGDSGDNNRDQSNRHINDPEVESKELESDNGEVLNTFDQPPTDENEKANEAPSEMPNLLLSQNNIALASETREVPLPVHLLGRLERSEYCDSCVILRSTRDNFLPIEFPVHKLVVTRSPLVATIFNSHGHLDRNEIIAVAGDNFGMIKGFELALRFLYGLPLLTMGRLRAVTLSSFGYAEDTKEVLHFPIPAAMVDLALCYATSGLFFQLHTVVETGFRLAADLVGWDTVEVILFFSLHVTKFAVKLDTSFIPCNGGEAFERDQRTYVDSQSVTQELQEVWAPRLIHAVLGFICNYVNANEFSLFVQAQSTSLPDRIPEHLRSLPGSILTNPRLARLKFGSFASINEHKPAREVVIASAILMNLPFKQLKEAFEIMAARRVLSSPLAHSIVTAREIRRLQALRVLATHSNDTMNESSAEVQELGYREYLTSNGASWDMQAPPTKPTEIKLKREWMGLAVVQITVAQHHITS
ncbi:hypothetical protein EYZ11_002080 [Aspergillus tanneri]|uniref:BTB domain-containing protein n=1 Tax=Aspergillus tanneri TaxID=1220188 RepID=A0A4S3JU64_9EURO|nr:hypothetical protein EYZ11_002080 [Aspergillus tanneri]